MVIKIIIFILSCLAVFFLGRFLYAEYLISQTQQMTSPQQIYQYQQNAIKLVPNNDYYHRIFSQTSLALADSLTKGSTPSGEKQKTIGGLITQSIDEAKLATSIAPTWQNYQNLGNIYKNLIGLVPKADDYSLASFRLAAVKTQNLASLAQIQTQIASVYVLLKNNGRAEQFYRNALMIKPDYGIALYGLALIQKENGQTKEALDNFKKALNLTKRISPDYYKIKKEIDSIAY